MEEVEVETAHILKGKQLKLRTDVGISVMFSLDVFECESPYVMIFVLQAEGRETRMDVHKADLAKELHEWFEGKTVRNSSLEVSSRVGNAMQQFVKLGKTPRQEDLIMWILSRSELYWDNQRSLTLGGMERNSGRSDDVDLDTHHGSRTSASLTCGRLVRIGDSDALLSSGGLIDTFKSIMEGRPPPRYTSQPSSSGALYTNSTTDRRTQVYSDDDDETHTFKLTRELLGKSQALGELTRSKVKGRPGANLTQDLLSLNQESSTLGSEIRRARKNIEVAMEQRRKCIEVTKARREQTSLKQRKIRESLTAKSQQGSWTARAAVELQTLIRMHGDIEDDIKIHKNRALRVAIQDGWTMAPNGNINRTGVSVPGPVLGLGPLPPKAITAIPDPRIALVTKQYYWDSSGRRHERPDSEDDVHASVVEQAMEVIRRTAANASAYKLDLRQVFLEFDTSGDGLLSCEEMAEAFLRLGVRLDVDTLAALFRHFDPNESGSVHYGEFVWAFFNRRAMVRQWKRNTEGYTLQQLRDKFHQHDVNGDGKLNRKEFAHLLWSFGISLSDSELLILMDRFDADSDGSIDMIEFFEFIEKEKHSLHLDPQQHAQHLRESISRTRQSQPRPLSERDGMRGTSQDRAPPPPAYQRSWDFSPARRRPHTSSSTYEEGIPLPLPLSGSPLKSAYAHSSKDTMSVSGALERSSKMSSCSGDASALSALNGRTQSESEKSYRRGSSSNSDHRSQREVEESKEVDVGSDRYSISEKANKPESMLYDREIGKGRRNGCDSASERTWRGWDEKGEGPGERKGAGVRHGDDSVSVEDALWAVKMLQAQAHVEKRLGRDYY